MGTRAVAIGTSLVFLLAACGGSDGDSGSPDAPTESSDESGGGEQADDAPMGDSSTYRGELEDGTVLTIRLDVDESDPVIAPFAGFREQAGVTDPVVWIAGSIEVPADFDESAGPPTGRILTFVAPGSDVISESNTTSAFACGQLDDWFGASSGDGAEALNEAYLEIFSGTCGDQSLGVIAEVGATTEYAMVVEGTDVPDFERLFAGLLSELQPTE